MKHYDHIINLPHHQSPTHVRMSMSERAAQFGAFNVLSGFEEELDETARFVAERPMLTETQQDALNLAIARLNTETSPEIAVTCFVPDARKCGGEFVTYIGFFRFLDTAAGMLRFADGRNLPMDDIYSIAFTEDAHETLY